MDTVHECDRRTDGQTDIITITKTVQRIASHGKNCKCSRIIILEHSYFPVSIQPDVYAIVRIKMIKYKSTKPRKIKSNEN